MKGICPGCEKEHDLVLASAVEIIEVRGEPIPVEVEFLTCTECGEEFDDPQSGRDPLDDAYREYRRRHSLTQPEDIRDFRAKYALTQQELAGLLGWGGATLSRCENGALQDEAHETTLKLAMEPGNLLALVREKPLALAEEKRERIVKMLEEIMEGEECRPLDVVYGARFGDYDPSLLSGFRRLDLSKLVNAILFFCTGAEVLKTKLNKLLFYADFWHYREYAVSITGARYVHLPFGPVPDKYDYFFAALHHEEKALRIEERVCGDYVGEVYIAEREPALTVFSTSELKILANVKERFESHSATMITKLSHQERGYVETGPGDFIPYSFAESLSV